MTNLSTIIGKLRHKINTGDLGSSQHYLRETISKQIKAIGKILYVGKEITDEIKTSLENLLKEVNKCNNKEELVQLVENKIIKTLQNNMTATPQNEQKKTVEKVVKSDVRQGTKIFQKNEGKNNSDWKIEQKKKELIEELKKQHTSIKINHRNKDEIRGKQIHIYFEDDSQFDFFIPQKKIKINDYLNNEEYASRRAQSTSPKKLCKLLNAIKKYMKEGGVDIDKDYFNQDIDYNDQILHSDSEAGKIAAEIMQLNGSHFVNIEKDSPKIPFEEGVQRSEAYTLMSHPGHFVLSKFKVNGPYNEAERYVLMEGV